MNREENEESRSKGRHYCNAVVSYVYIVEMVVEVIQV